MHLVPEAPPATVVATVSVSDMRERIRRKSRLKGRQPEDAAMADVAQLLGPRPADGYRRDLLIEYLHRLNDHLGVLHDRHLVALASQMNLPMAEVYEVASFYHHFEIVRGEEAQAITLTPAHLLSNRTHTFVYSFDGQQWRWQNGQRLTKIPGQNDRMDELALAEVSAPGPQGFAGCLPASIAPPAATK